MRHDTTHEVMQGAPLQALQAALQAAPRRHGHRVSAAGAARRAALTLLLALGSGAAPAQDYPNRAVVIVAPTSPGTSSDLIGREIGQRLATSLGKPVVVENRAGASGNIGTDYAAAARPDGHILFLSSTSGVVNEITNPIPPKAKLARDFDPIALSGSVPFALAVPTDFPVRSVDELIAEARRRPGQLNYAGFTGGMISFLGELLKHEAKIDIVMVPYKNSPDAQVDVIAGRVPIWFTTGPAALTVARGGRVRILAVASSKRVPSAPGIPTMAELGYPSLTAEVTFYFLAPPGTPKPVIARLNRDINAAMAVRETVEKLATAGVDPTPAIAPEEVGKVIQAEFAQWTRIVATTRKK